MTAIEHSIAFVDEWDPELAGKFRGSSSADIDALEAAMGRPCTPVYRAFLERMGEDAGDIDFGQHATSIPLLLEERRTALASLPPGVELLAMPTADDEDDIYLLHDEARPDDAKIVRHPTLEYARSGDFQIAKAEAVAGGFGELLCLPVLNRHRVLVEPHRIALTAALVEDDALGRCRAISAAFGAVPYWFSNDWTYVAHVDGVVVVAKQAPGWYLSVGVAGPERYAWAAVAGTLAFLLGLQPYR